MEKASFRPPENRPGSSPLRIGLLVDSVTVSKYIYDFTQWAQSQANIAVTHFILPEIETKHQRVFMRDLIDSAKRDGLFFVLAQIALSLVNRFERAIIKRNKRHFEHLLEFDISALVAGNIAIKPIISMSTSGLVYRFSEGDIQKVKELELDLLLQCGTCILSGGILNASRLGTISPSLGDNRLNRDTPAGFWEVYRREDMTGFTIQRLNDVLSSGDVLMEGRVATRHYYTLNQAFAARKASYYLKLVIEKIALTRKLPERVPTFPYSNSLFSHPNLREVAIYFAALCYTLLKKKIKSFLNIHYRFTVAYVQQNWRDAELFRAVKLKNRPFHYLADPFVIARSGKNYCFVEDFDYLTQRGIIDVYELTPTSGLRIGTAVKEDFHLSFPYLFEYRDQLYMCPESSENRDIRIYKCVDFPLQWKLEKIVMDRVSAADSMIFEKDRKWWLLTNIDLAGVGDHSSELCIYSAESPLGENWKPHPLNPIIVDASRARNAGCLVEGNSYFRFSQSQGFDFYGKRVLINKIIELSDTAYAESCVSVLTPSFQPGLVGTHHMHSNGQITVFDFSMNSKVNTAC